jgi:hypothetical protein
MPTCKEEAGSLQGHRLRVRVDDDNFLAWPVSNFEYQNTDFNDAAA